MDRLLILDFYGKSVIEPILEVSNEMTMIVNTTDDQHTTNRTKTLTGSQQEMYQSPEELNRQELIEEEKIPRAQTQRQEPRVRMTVTSQVQSPHNYTVQSDDEDENESQDEQQHSEAESGPKFTEQELRQRLDSMERELLSERQQRQIANRESRGLRQHMVLGGSFASRGSNANKHQSNPNEMFYSAKTSLPDKKVAQTTSSQRSGASSMKSGGSKLNKIDEEQ